MSTSRPFAYNTGSQISGTEQIGNLAIGIPDSGFSNSGLKWWNGPDENLGYVIACEVPENTQPTPENSVTASVCFYRSKFLTDESFIDLAEYITKKANDPQNFVSGANAKIWLNDNGYWTSYTHLVTSGLKLHLDAGNISSYDGTGNSWYDLSQNANDATLINTPSFDNTTAGGLFSFDDNSFEYATIPDIGNLSTFTIEVWCRVHKSLSGKVTSVISNQYDLGSKLNFSIGTNRAPGNYNMSFGYFDGAWRTVDGFQVTLNTWYHLVGTYDGSTLKFYVNNSLDTQSSYTGTPQSGGEIRIARRWDSPSNLTSNFFDGDVSIVRIYNRALSSSEIDQNYNIDKSRFGY